MGRKPVSVILFTLVLIGLLTLAFKIQPVKAERTIIVPDNYPAIQAAIDVASSGDTVFVKAGTYYENVVMNRAVLLIGENRETTIIDANKTGHVINVMGDEVTIAGFTLRNSGYLSDGIYIDRCHNTYILNNKIIENRRFAIHLTYSSHNTISGNNLTANNYGAIYLEYSCNNNTISGNHMTNNNIWGIVLERSSSNTVSGNHISNSDYGVELDSSSYNTVSENHIVASRYDGMVLLDSSENNVISGNHIVNSQRCNIRLGQSSLVYARRNTIYHNNFIGAKQVFTGESMNAWDNGYPSGGNYWSDYNGSDLFNGPFQNLTGSDGVGDTPYIIDEDNKDNYPLINPHIDASPPMITIPYPKNTKAYAHTLIPLIFIVDEYTSWTGYSIDGEANVTITGSITLTLSEGSHGIRVYANDTYGNMGCSDIISFMVDITAPTIGIPSRIPKNDAEPDQEVKVLVNVTDFVSAVKNVTLSYNLNDSAIWTNLPMILNFTTGLYEVIIPGQQANNLVKYEIEAYDNAGNYRVEDNSGQYFVYTVIPEFLSLLILPLFMVATLLAVIVYRRKHAITA